MKGVCSFLIHRTRLISSSLLPKRIYAKRESAEELYQTVYAAPAAMRRTLRTLIGVSVVLAVLLLLSALLLYRQEHRHLSALFDENWGFEDEISQRKDSF